MRKPFTLERIAHLAGVSPSTVSRALNPSTSHLISEARRNLIQELSSRYSYLPSLSARATATGKTYNVALILGALANDLSNPLYALFIRGINAALQSEGYCLSLLWTGASQSSMDLTSASFLQSNVADAYILGSSMLGKATRSAAHSCGRPVLVLNSEPDGKEQEFINLNRNCREAYESAWQGQPKNRWQHAVFFGVNTANSTYKYNELTQAAPKPAKCELFLFDDVKHNFLFDLSNAEDAATSEIEKLKAFKLFFCSSDLIAVGLARAMRRHGILAGRDFHLVGFDGMELSGEHPRFASIYTPWEEAGKTAVKTLLASQSWDLSIKSLQ